MYVTTVHLRGMPTAHAIASYRGLLSRDGTGPEPGLGPEAGRAEAGGGTGRGRGRGGADLYHQQTSKPQTRNRKMGQHAGRAAEADRWLAIVWFVWSGTGHGQACVASEVGKALLVRALARVENAFVVTSVVAVADAEMYHAKEGKR